MNTSYGRKMNADIFELILCVRLLILIEIKPAPIYNSISPLWRYSNGVMYTDNASNNKTNSERQYLPHEPDSQKATKQKPNTGYVYFHLIIALRYSAVRSARQFSGAV